MPEGEALIENTDLMAVVVPNVSEAASEEEKADVQPYISFQEAWDDLALLLLDDFTKDWGRNVVKEIEEGYDAILPKLTESWAVFEKELDDGNLHGVLDYFQELYLMRSPTLQRRASSCLDFISSHLDQIDDLLSQERRPEDVVRCVDLVVSATKGTTYTYDEEEDYLYEDYSNTAFLEKYLDDVIEFDLENKNQFNPRTATVIRTVLEHGDGYQDGQIVEKVDSLFQREDVDPLLPAQWVADLVQNKTAASFLRPIISSQLERYALDPYIILADWELSNQKNPNFALGAHFLHLVKLEHAWPGSGKILNEEFGLSDFGRYPLELLERQYEERDRRDDPYGLIIYPQNDWNGAFLQDEGVFQRLQQDLGHETLLRAYEVETPLNTIEALNNARKKFGKASFLVLGGHGDKESIAFGDFNNRRQKIQTEDVKRKGADALEHAFIKDPTIILVSCSTGQLGGVGEAISALGEHGATVIVPETPTNIKNISVNKNEAGKLNFAVEYREDVDKTYRAGKLIEEDG